MESQIDSNNTEFAANIFLSKDIVEVILILYDLNHARIAEDSIVLRIH